MNISITLQYQTMITATSYMIGIDYVGVNAVIHNIIIMVIHVTW